MNYDIKHQPEELRFETEVEGIKAYLEYRLVNHSLDIIHTYVPPTLEGRGIANVLTQTAYEYALAHGLKPEATCSYAVMWLKRHPEIK